MAKAEKPARPTTNGATAHRPIGAKRKRANQPVPTPKGGKMTEKRWADYLANIANGSSHRDAAHGVGLTMPTVDAYLISNVAAGSQLRDAKVLASRRHWPMEKIEAVLVQIAVGKTMRQAFDECEIDRSQVSSLYQLFLKDKALRKWYDEARELASESMADEIIDISDETSQDWKEDSNGNEKPNHEVINRSRLRVQTRQWLMGRYVPKRFGDTKHHLHEGELNINHAAVLTGGRRRLEKLHAQRKGTTVDAATGEVVPNE